MQPLLKTIELLANIIALGAEEAYEKIKSTAPMYIKSLLITTLLWLLIVPSLAILKAVTGVELFGYLFVFAALVFTLAIGLLWTPLGILVGMLSGQTINPSKAGNRYVKFVATVFFFELMASIYIMRVPAHQNIGAIPILIVSVLAVILGSAIWGGWISGRFYTFIATMLMLFSTLSFFLPKTFDAVSDKIDDVDNSLAEFVNDTTSVDIDTPTPNSAESAGVGGTTSSFSRNQPKPIQLDPYKPSRLIPVYKNKFRVQSPGWIEFHLERSGDKIRVDGGTITLTHSNGKTESLSEFPSKLQTGDWAFRLTGQTGTAIVTIL